MDSTKNQKCRDTQSHKTTSEITVTKETSNRESKLTNSSCTQKH